MHILVLGGGGFIGAHLVATLLAQGHEVRVLERPYRQRTQLIPQHPKLEWLEGDFGNVQDIRRAIAGVDAIYHLVSTTQPQSSNDDPVFDVESNLVATLRLLDALRGTTARLIFVSSGGTVYGVPQHTPIPESHPTDPTCSYGIAKLAIEKYLALYHLLHGLDYRILRLANPYGSGQETNRAQGVVGTFLTRVLQDESITVWGDGSVVRDYLYIIDSIAALTQALTHEGAHRLFNIGSGQGHSVREIITAIEQVSGKNAKVEYTPGRAFDIPVNVLDISRAQAELQWSPRISLLDGLQLTLAQLQRKS